MSYSVKISTSTYLSSHQILPYEYYYSKEFRRDIENARIKHGIEKVFKESGDYFVVFESEEQANMFLLTH